MPRPPKQRYIQSPPQVVVYKPAGIPSRLLEWITLSLDEFEAIRLIDHKDNDQETVAALMGVSRPTVTRIYQSARKKIAAILVNGQALKIEGGPIRHSPQNPSPQNTITGNYSKDATQRNTQGRGRGSGRGRGRRNIDR